MNTMMKIFSILVSTLLFVMIFTGCAKNASNEKTTLKSEETTDTSKETDAELSKIATAKVGNIVQFGFYEQDNNTADGKEKIDWRVLVVKKGKALLLSVKILDCEPYNETVSVVNWATCTLRSWLNDNFYNTAFSFSEQARIKTSTIANEGDPLYDTDGVNTNDKLFLLSYADIINPAYGFSSNEYAIDTARQAQGTDFAKSNGLSVYDNSPYLGNGEWWLRTSGYQDLGCYVDGDGSANNINYYAYVISVDNTSIGVRPALWINL